MTLGASAVAAQNSGNETFKDFGVAVDGPSAMEHSLDEMIDYIEVYLDPQAAAALRVATDATSGSIRVIELVSPRSRGGYSDGGTIAISTNGQPLWRCAVVLLHEFDHSVAAQTCAPGDADAADCTTATEPKPSCGACEHARRKGEDIERLGHLACEWFSVLAPEEIASVCADVRKSWEDAEQKLEECGNDQCPAADIPSIHSIAVLPPCCN